MIKTKIRKQTSKPWPQHLCYWCFFPKGIDDIIWLLKFCFSVGNQQRNANAEPVTAYWVCLSALRTLCPCSFSTAFLLFSSESLPLEVTNLFSFSIKPTSLCYWSRLRRRSFLIALSGSVLLFTAALLPVVCGLTSGRCRDDLISVRICWSFSIMWRHKSAAVDKHISFSPFCLVQFYLSTERRQMILNVETQKESEKKEILLSAVHLVVSTLTLSPCRRPQQSSSHLSMWRWGLEPLPAAACCAAHNHR